MFYLQSPRLGDKHYETNFRNRFRLPYDVFREILADIMINPLFERWHHKRVDTPVVLGLLLLGAVRYLGRGWTFDDLEESTAISLYVHHDCFTYLSSMDANICIQGMLSIRQQQLK